MPEAFNSHEPLWSKLTMKNHPPRQATAKALSGLPFILWPQLGSRLGSRFIRPDGTHLICDGTVRWPFFFAAPMREAIGIKIQEEYKRLAIAAYERFGQKTWSSLRDDFSDSNLASADHRIIKMTPLGPQLHKREVATSRTSEVFDKISKSQTQLLAEMEHSRWVAERLLAGWRFAPEGETVEAIEQNKKRKLNHNFVPCENSVKIAKRISVR